MEELIIQKSELELQMESLDIAFDLEEQLFFSNDSFNSLIMKIRSSQSLNLKEITKYGYTEEVENNEVVCRCMNGDSIEMKEYNSENPDSLLIILGRREINRMDGI